MLSYIILWGGYSMKNTTTSDFTTDTKMDYIEAVDTLMHELNKVDLSDDAIWYSEEEVKNMLGIDNAH